MIKALEFFSGIGAFAVAARASGLLEIAAAFDQSEAANRVYKLNFGHAPRARNLDSIPSGDIPDADMWWLSPPCTPYSVRGNRKDIDDARAQSFLHLINLIGDRRPRLLAVENVLGFKTSQVNALLQNTLKNQGYHVRTIDLCSTDLGTPMRRPRHFVLASTTPLPVLDAPQNAGAQALRTYLVDGTCRRSELRPSAQTVQRYGASYDIVDPLDERAVAICFTSGYGKSQKVSGSLIKVPHSDNQLRHFSPREILNLLGFPADFLFPEDIPLETAWRLVGNSVDVRCVQFCLHQIMRAAPSVPLP